ncbi:MAG: transcriptional repressor LexA [Eubacteriales bacterium]|jgi:repressor LexA|nr:transcriptional repressor LexA [Eubacteriales bacterium]
MYDDLTSRQLEILSFITEFISSNGYPPSIREIGKAVGLKSTSSVHNHIQALERLGYITKNGLKKRSMFPSNLSKHINVPVVGKITAGAPILAVENIEDYFPIPESFAKNKDLFILTISGDSMRDAGILDGDYVIVQKQNTAQSGDIVAALIDNEATVKTFYKTDTEIILQPENPAYEPIKLKQVEILGKITGVFRML